MNAIREGDQSSEAEDAGTKREYKGLERDRV